LNINQKETRDLKMSERKVVGRGIAILLGVICIVSIAGLVGAMAYYTMYVSNHGHTNADYDSLNSQYNAYVSSHSHTNADYDVMWAPKLIEVNLVANDNHPFLSSPYLNVNGYIVNVHENWAYNCQLHVVAYQSGGVTAFDTYINLGTIAGESSTQVNSNLYYSGNGITGYTITPEWNATP
jgi:hypothetical protein